MRGGVVRQSSPTTGGCGARAREQPFEGIWSRSRRTGDGSERTSTPGLGQRIIGAPTAKLELLYRRYCLPESGRAGDDLASSRLRCACASCASAPARGLAREAARLAHVPDAAGRDRLVARAAGAVCDTVNKLAAPPAARGDYSPGRIRAGTVVRTLPPLLARIWSSKTIGPQEVLAYTSEAGHAAIVVGRAATRSARSQTAPISCCSTSCPHVSVSRSAALKGETITRRLSRVVMSREVDEVDRVAASAGRRRLRGQAYSLGSHLAHRRCVAAMTPLSRTAAPPCSHCASIATRPRVGVLGGVTLTPRVGAFHPAGTRGRVQSPSLLPTTLGQSASDHATVDTHVKRCAKSGAAPVPHRDRARGRVPVHARADTCPAVAPTTTTIHETGIRGKLFAVHSAYIVSLLSGSSTCALLERTCASHPRGSFRRLALVERAAPATRSRRTAWTRWRPISAARARARTSRRGGTVIGDRVATAISPACRTPATRPEVSAAPRAARMSTVQRHVRDASWTRPPDGAARGRRRRPASPSAGDEV